MSMSVDPIKRILSIVLSIMMTSNSTGDFSTDRTCVNVLAKTAHFTEI